LLGIESMDPKKYKVAAFFKDDKGKGVWVKPRYEDTDVMIANDLGNLASLGTGSMTDAQSKVGNPGVRDGIFKVQGPDGATHYFAAGASFRGRPDDWQVKAMYFEINPQENPTLLKAFPELAEKSVSH
jgi:hypothetical protein